MSNTFIRGTERSLTCNITLFFIHHHIISLHWINEIVKITNLLVSTVARNSGNRLIGRVGCYAYTCNCNYNLISISLSCQLNVQRSRINILIKSL